MFCPLNTLRRWSVRKLRLKSFLGLLWLCPILMIKRVRAFQLSSDRRRFLSRRSMAYVNNEDNEVVPAVAYRNDSLGISAESRIESDSSPPPSSSLTTTTRTDFAGAGTLGDIMSKDDDPEEGNLGPSKAGLVTLEGGTLASRFGITSPLDRMALTANGNLQRIFSSYYDAPVHVVVDKCVQTSPELWDRVVHLTVHQQTFCTACASVTVHDDHCKELVRSGKVGLGQVFRFLDRLPTFELLDAGYNEDTGGLWRVYELKCEEVSCSIREDFHQSAWDFEEVREAN